MVSKDGISDLNQKMKMVKIEMKVKKEDRNRVVGSLSSSEKERGRNKAAFVSLTSLMEKEKKRGGAGVFSSAKPTIVHCGHSETVNPLPEDLLFEVLGRVERIKSLYQYKCVSKTWRSIIECPSFWEAYRSHHRGGILLSIARVIPDGNKMDPDNFHSFESSLENSSPGGVSPPVEVSFFYSPIVDKEPEPFFSRAVIPPFKFNQFRGMTQVVRGLICICADTRVFVSNVCTGETMRLPDTKYRPDNAVEAMYFGYDAISRVYKLLKISASGTEGNAIEQTLLPNLDDVSCRRLECEILTLGHDSQWRKLSDVGAPTIRRRYGIFSSGQPLLFNGVMYWVVDESVPSLRLITFDLNKEIFGWLKSPQYPLQESLWPGWRFAHFGGRPALYFCFRECLSINTLDDDQGDSWTSHAIPLPRGFVSVSGKAVANLPTGQTLFLNLGSIRCLTVGHTIIDSYDHQEKKIETVLVGSLSELLDARVRDVAVTCLEEDVCRPLSVQLGGS